ncbi:nuclear pore complex protein Nup153 isoform 2-T2 [Discoglossus pictus]
MAAAGGAGPGGKIRSRRYHLSSGRTPYSKSRQAGQQGIISRVTDTVKSIVPGWLQKYFNKDEAADGVQGASESIVEHAENSENYVDHHIYVDDEVSPTSDERVITEPVANEEPSTSRSALNTPDTLTRPSLHRANLNFNILDSPALHCQPSTSSAFPIGSSGFSLVKEIKDSTSQNDDDNISTTSGFSSRASEKDVAVSKATIAPPLWSPEADRTQPLSQNSSMASKKPVFNLSAFGALSPSLGNTSVLKSSQLGDSPFYPGKTTYGGAAAVRSSKVRGTPYQAPLRRQVKAKPANAQAYGVTSSTARRILQSLEKMSSPLADAKRIPSAASSPLSLTPERSFLDVIENPPKRKKVDPLYPPVKKLITPKSISVSTNRSFYIKPSLTPSASANASSRRFQAEKHKDPSKNHVPGRPAVLQSESLSYPKFSTPASNGLSSGGGGKMMRERGSHYVTKPAEEEVIEPALPEFALPLSTDKLPSFNFSTLPSTARSPVTPGKPADSKSKITNSANKSPVYTFSSPIVKSTESDAQSPGSSVDFTFSVPAMKMSSPPTAVDNKMSARSSPAKMSNNVGKKTEEDDNGGFYKPAKTLKQGSVMDILRGPGFASSSSSQPPVSKNTTPLSRPAGSTFSMGKVAFGDGNKQALGLWQCNTCLVENKASDGRCVACSALKDLPPGANKQPTTSTLSSSTKSTVFSTVKQGFGDKFKVATGTWDCDTCLVQNKPEVTKCVACETPKPGAGAKAALLLPPTVKSVATTDKMAPVSLFEAFKKPEGSWECTVCCVQNKEQDSKCVACTSEKPGGSSASVKTLTPAPAATTTGQLGSLDQFKKPAGSWDCDVCLIQNQPKATKCAACESAKPGTIAELKGFGAPAASTGTSAFKFGLPSSGSTGEIKFGASTDSASSANTPAAGFSFSKFTGDIKFGVSSSASSSTEEKKDKGFTFGTATSVSNPSSTGFKFGTANSAPQTEKDSVGKPLTSGFSFGTGSSTTSAPAADSPGATGFQFQPAKDKLPNPATSFHLKETEEKKPETSTIGSFSFGKLEQKDSVSSPFSFGNQDAKSDATSTGQSFGMKSDGEESKPFAFGKSEQTKENKSAPAAFTFGVSTATEKKDSDQTAKPVFGFGSLAPTADTGASKQTFSFLSGGCTAAQSSTPASSTSVFGSTATANASSGTSSVFGTAAQPSNPSSSTNVFGNTASSNTPTSSTSVFGSSAPSSNPASSTSVFGSAASSSAPPSSSNVFGSAAPTSTSTSSSSIFGSAAPVTTSAGSSSVFGAAPSTNTSANSGNIFGSSATVPNPSAGTFVFGQPSTTASGSVFGNTNESKQAFVFSGPESKPVTSSSNASSAPSPFLFGASAAANPAAPSFNFGAANTSNVTGTGSSPFVFGPSSTAPAQSSLTVGANPVPAFGQSASQPSVPAFGSSSSTSLFPASSQPVPAFGTVSSSVQPPAFGQQAAQPAFGSSGAPASGSAFQFGGNANTNFNFASGGSSGVFTFGSSSGGASTFGSSSGGASTFGSSSGGASTFGSNSGGAPAQPAQPGFVFNQPPAFNMGTNGRTTQTTAISARKIKTARRRK